MKIKTKLLLIILLVFGAGVVAVGSYYLLVARRGQIEATSTESNELLGWRFPANKLPLAESNQDQLAYSVLRNPGQRTQGLPIRLKIPVIGVDAAVEDAVITPDGRMDVPAGSVNVAWFSLGPPPGQVGSAVIGGHFGSSNGIPFVFYQLDKLKPGDTVEILDDRGQTLTFIVRSIRLFEQNADATAVFTSNDGLAHLNLVTCEGIWNKANNSYPQRLVVFTDKKTGN